MSDKLLEALLSGTPSSKHLGRSDDDSTPVPQREESDNEARRLNRFFEEVLFEIKHCWVFFTQSCTKVSQSFRKC